MSLRALKKHQNNPTSSTTKKSNLYKKSIQQQRRSSVQQEQLKINVSSFSLASDLRSQKQLLGRSYFSNPEIHRIERPINHLRTKSENDISSYTAANREFVGAKSEICLQTISSHNYNQETKDRFQTPTKLSSKQNRHSKMISGARSHRDVSNSLHVRTKSCSPIPRRMSESSLNSSYSQRTALSSSSYGETGELTPNRSNLIVGIRGYEVIEERARFTVYKLRVENPLTNDCWLVLRRYTDFVRLNNKLRQTFPHITLMLPRKKIFGDNFNSVFLDNRVQGLQMFVNSVMAKDELRKCKTVREFFCLDEPPSYSESMEECRAIFEAQEETIAHLKMQIASKNELILNLQQKLREELSEKEQLKEVIKRLNSEPGAKYALETLSTDPKDED